MTKKFIALLLSAVVLFTCVCVNVSAADGDPAPELTITKNVKVIVTDKHILTEGALSSFGVDVKLLDTNVVAFDGSTTEHTLTVKSISSHRDGQAAVEYDAENPDPFLDVFRFTETDDEGNIIRKSVPIDIVVQIDFKDAEVFGELDLETTVSGFSLPPDLGISLGDAIAVPTDIVETVHVTEFPALASIDSANLSQKQFYKDSEKPELNGVSVSATTTAGYSGTITYGAGNTHMFSTLPDKNEKLTVDTESITTYFFGQQISPYPLPVTVEHDWSDHLVSITTDKYSDTKPGYHAIKCNGCGEAHSAAPHTPDDANWKSNEDQTFVKNGTESTVCLDCGATLTRDVSGSADFNDAFANYHFLKVIFDYINLILRIIGNAGIN